MSEAASARLSAALRSCSARICAVTSSVTPSNQRIRPSASKRGAFWVRSHRSAPLCVFVNVGGISTGCRRAHTSASLAPITSALSVNTSLSLFPRASRSVRSKMRAHSAFQTTNWPTVSSSTLLTKTPTGKCKRMALRKRLVSSSLCSVALSFFTALARSEISLLARRRDSTRRASALRLSISSFDSFRGTESVTQRVPMASPSSPVIRGTPA